MSLPSPSQSVSHKQFHQCLNHKKKLSLRHSSPSFGSFNLFQASFWLGVDKVLQNLLKSYKIELRHSFQSCILIPRKCPRKTPFQHTVGGGAGISILCPPQLRRPCFEVVMRSRSSALMACSKTNPFFSETGAGRFGPFHLQIWK